MADEILVLVSCSKQEAKGIARPLIEEKLSSCVSVLPTVQSIYFWQGKICEEEECLLLIKSNSASWAELEKRIKTLHSYEIPEIIAVPVKHGHQPYLNWLNEYLENRG